MSRSDDVRSAIAYLEAMAYKVVEEKVGYTLIYPDGGGSDRCADFELVRLASEMGAVFSKEDLT